MHNQVLRIQHPGSCTSERQYIFEVLFHDFLDVEFVTYICNGANVTISKGGRYIELPDIFFGLVAGENWRRKLSYPNTPLAVLKVDGLGFKVSPFENYLPVLFGKPEFSSSENRIRIGIDIFGSSFFLLSRYEEVVSYERDSYGRFPFRASIASREGLHLRPLVNEYLELLWGCMKRLWPDLKRRRRHYRFLVSCDIDAAYSPGVRSLSGLGRSVAADVIKRKNPRLAVQDMLGSLLARKGSFRFDPYYVFDWIMTVNEMLDNRVAFFLMTDNVQKIHGVSYSIFEDVISSLMKRIHLRGHEIGLHPSLETFQNGFQMKKEARILLNCMRNSGIRQATFGSRQHFLRWDAASTPRLLQEAGVAYDSTLGYPDVVGFRCGTCYEYPLYDIVRRKTLRIKARPLIVMENSLFRCLKSFKEFDEPFLLIKKLVNICRRFSGDFTLLWHNTHLQSKAEKKAYMKVIELAS